jgi:hypothetical protein
MVQIHKTTTTGRVKPLKNGETISEPEIDYEDYEPSVFDVACSTYDVATRADVS